MDLVPALLESIRLQALQQYTILDTPPESAYDRITRLTASILRAPLAAITFVDENRVCIKSAFGFQDDDVPREESFCAQTILCDSLLEVPDASLHPDFQNLPLVTGEAQIRFYAGVPLKSPAGLALGTLCILDRAPRVLSNEERDTLASMAAVVSDTLALRLAIRERSQLATAITHVSSSVVLSDPTLPDNPIVFVNPAFAAMSGYSFDEVKGKNCRFLQGPDSDPETIQKIRDAISQKQTFQGEILNYRKDGTPFWNHLIISPVLNAEGETINFVGLQTDITERKYTVDRLRESYEKIQAAESMRDSLTQMVIHDLRSPLATIVGYLGIIETAGDGRLSAREHEFIKTAAKGAATLQEMITSLLDLNRLETGKMPLHTEPVDIRKIIHASVDSFRPILGGRSLVRQLPEQPLEALCDINLATRTITNLVSNAIKFTPSGGEIRIIATLEGSEVKVAVRDTGKGIPPEARTRIFEKFGQLHAARHTTGLGLTFCKLAVEAQRGSIGVESIEGKGATFWFKVPRLPSANGQEVKTMSALKTVPLDDAGQELAARF